MTYYLVENAKGCVQTTWTNEGEGRVAQITIILYKIYLVKVSHTPSFFEISFISNGF